MITRFFCRKCRDYALFGVESRQKFWQKFLEILRILAEILRKKLTTGVSGIRTVPTQKFLSIGKKNKVSQLFPPKNVLSVERAMGGYFEGRRV